MTTPVRLVGSPWRIWMTRPVLMTTAPGACLLAVAGLGAVSGVAATVVAVALAGGAVVACVLTARRSCAVVDDAGITDVRLWRTVHWSWDEAVVIASSSYGGRGGSREEHLVVCVRDDPYPKVLKGFAPGTDLDVGLALQRLARAGWPVDLRPDAAETWWYLDPRRTRR